MTEQVNLCSMTGFGRGTQTRAGLQCTVELKSVNHRYCEVKVRAPQDLGHLESVLKALVQKKMHRGRVEVSIRLESESGDVARPRLNLEQAQAYQRLFEELCTTMEQPVSSLEPQALFQMPGVLTLDSSPTLSEKEVDALVQDTFLQAIEPFLAMRRREGIHLRDDLLGRLETLESGLQELRELAAEEPVSLVQRLQQRLEQWLPELGIEHVEPQRLHQEVAILADKADVTEELTRLQSHFQQFRGMLLESGEVGRRLDFLCQEIHREFNTIGSKSNHARTVEVLIALKAEGNKLREQVQNLE